MLQRHHRKGLFAAMLGSLRSMAGTAAQPRLEGAVIAAGDGYWRAHWDFGLLMRRGTALIGSERAGVLAVNALLPFGLAWGRASGERALASRALESYGCYGALAENEVTRYMSGLLSYRAPSAAAHQGLVHIFRTWCREKRCESCPAGQKKPWTGRAGNPKS